MEIAAGRRDSARKVERWVTRAAQVDALIAIVVRRSTEREPQGLKKKKLYAGGDQLMLRLASEEVIGYIRVIEQHRVGDEVKSGQSGEATYLIEVPSTSKRYMFVDGKDSGNKFAMSWELLQTAINA